MSYNLAGSGRYLTTTPSLGLDGGSNNRGGAPLTCLKIKYKLRAT